MVFIFHHDTVGIKFIPLRTPGGEIIPGSGLFVKIKKTVAAEPSAREDTKKTSLDEQVGDEEIAVADIEHRSYYTDEDTILSCEDSFESETKREEQLRPTRRRYSTPASLMYTSGHSKGCMHLNIIAEVNEDAEDLSTTHDS